MVQKKQPEADTVTIGVLLLNDFSMMAFSSFIEPFRALNRACSEQLYDWKFISEDGDVAVASNGAQILTDYNLAEGKTDIPDFQIVCVCAGVNVSYHASDRILSWLRAQSVKGPLLGGVSTATFVLAKAGLLDGYKCTTHWEGVDSLRESYPKLMVTNSLFEIDQQRFTCAGGIASMDLALHWIGEKFGSVLKSAVADQFVHGSGRKGEEPQKQNLIERYSIHNEKLLNVVSLMEDNLEDPLSRDELAEHVVITTRQLERLFSRYLKVSPLNFYLQLRLDRARDLLRQTSMPISEIAIACGFVNFSHFARSYRTRFNHTPRNERAME